MKKYVLSITLSLICFQAFCQNNTDTIPFKDMIVPSSPAFNLLDISPTSIERPATVKALALNLSNSFGQSDFIPKNFAMQIAPFWLFKHPNMDVYKYNGLTFDRTKTSEAPLRFTHNIFYGLRNFSFSLATAAKDSSKNLPLNLNFISYSLKLNIINVRKKRVIDSLGFAIANLNRTLVADLSNASVVCNQLFDPATQGQAFNTCINNTVFRDSVKINAQRHYYDTLLSIRPAFAVDLAGASSTMFANRTFDDHHLYRTGGWLTLCFSQPLIKAEDKTMKGFYNAKNYINIYGIARVLKEDSTLDFKTYKNHTYFDFGGRLEFEFDRLSVSFESVHRNVRSNDDLNTSRNAALVQFKVNDNLFLTGTFGKNFGKRENLIAFLGLNWGLGKTALYNKLQTH